MARSNQDRLTKGRNTRSSNNGSYRRGGSTRRMPHGGYHGPGQIQTSSTVSTQRTAVRNRVAPVRPVRPISGNNMAVGVPSLYLSRLPNPQTNLTLGDDVDAMILAAVRDCPALSTGLSFRDWAIKLSNCVDTPAILELEAYINSYTANRGSFWRFMARLCCVASLGSGQGCCDQWDTD